MTLAKKQKTRSSKSSNLVVTRPEQEFAEVVKMIQAARQQAFTAVNTALIDLYWKVGEYISRKLESATWGEGAVEKLARYIQKSHPGQRGFTRRNLFRMRQFYETYGRDKKVSPLVTGSALQLVFHRFNCGNFI